MDRECTAHRSVPPFVSDSLNDGHDRYFALSWLKNDEAACVLANWSTDWSMVWYTGTEADRR